MNVIYLCGVFNQKQVQHMKNSQNLEIPYVFCYDEVKSSQNLTVYIQDKNGIEIEETYDLKEVIEVAISLGYLDGAMDLEEDKCLIRWDEDDRVREKVAYYNDLINGLTFSDEEMQEILYEIFKYTRDFYYKVEGAKVYTLKLIKYVSAHPGYADCEIVGGFNNGQPITVVTKWLDNYNVYTSKIEAYKRALLCAQVDAITLEHEVQKMLKAVA
jgi:hypothetical protein